MSAQLFTAVIGVAVHVAAGVVLGTIYFSGLWRTVRHFVAGARPMTTFLAMIGRFTLLGGVLTLVGLEGAMPLLALAGGLLIARPMVMRQLAGATR